MAGEIPSPTFGERNAVRFLRDRFTEAGLHNISEDEAGNAAGILPGKTGERKILVAAHVDKIWPEKEDHTISVTTDSLKGPGIADNSLGVAVLATLPLILETLDVELDADLILLGSTGSFGRGDLKGMRFFLDNTVETIDSAVCLEGIQLGRLSYSSLGMMRGEIEVEQPKAGHEWDGFGQSSSIGSLNRILDAILAIEKPEKPKTAVLIGSVEAGSGYNVPPTRGRIRFEIRSESAAEVERIHARIEDIVDECGAMDRCRAQLAVLARRSPGDIGFDHPLVREARRVLDELDIPTRIAPSISELSALLDHEIPALTLGLTTGEHRHSESESIQIEPVFSGIAQVVAMLQFMDRNLDADS